MVAKPLYTAILLLSLHMANSYILLTANLEDVHAIAKQIVASPVAQQFNKIIRRASDMFNHHVSLPDGDRAQLRAADGEASDVKYSPSQQEQQRSPPESGEASASLSELQRQVERRHGVADDVASLGKNASFYLASINKILQTV